MSKEEKWLDELRDSRILFDKNPPACGYVLLAIVSIFLCVALVWSIKTPRVYTIKARGTVTSSESNYVMCTCTGEIMDSHFVKGMLVKEGDILFTVKSIDFNLQKEQLELSREIYIRQISQYERLVASIKDDVNYFETGDSNDELYYSMFEAYKSKIAQNRLDISIYADYGYTEEQIKAEVEKNQGLISEIYFETIGNAQGAIEEANNQIANIDAQLAALASGQKEYVIKAPASGVLHLLGEYKDGMVVQAASVIASISPQNSGVIIESYVSTADMARINEGDTVRITIDGLVQNVYGSIDGVVKQIDSNVSSKTNVDGSVSQVFKVIIEMKNDYMISDDGEKVDIINGMTAEARITYDKLTYFDYLLENLGIKIR